MIAKRIEVKLFHSNKKVAIHEDIECLAYYNTFVENELFILNKEKLVQCFSDISMVNINKDYIYIKGYLKKDFKGFKIGEKVRIYIWL